MANQIIAEAKLKLVNELLTIEKSHTTTTTQSLQGGGGPGVVTIGTSEEDIDFGSITFKGWVFMLNLDDTNFVTWGPNSGGSMVAMGQMFAGEMALFRMRFSSTTLRMKADTASCKVYICGLAF